MRSKRLIAPSLALAAAGSLVLLSAAPGFAAKPLAEGKAVGLVLTVADTPTDSGAYSSTDNGNGESSTGSKDPLITVLGNQSLIQAGTLAQNAKSTSSKGKGSTVACAGLGGDGATLVSVEQGNCLKPGQNLTLDAANFDLSNVEVLPTDLIPGGALDPLNDLLQQILTPVSDGISTFLSTADIGVFLDLGAVQSRCTADFNDGETADTDITGASLYAKFPGVGRVDLLTLPVNPPPNTKVLTNLDVVVEELRKAIEKELSTALTGALDPLNLLTNTVLEQLNDNLIKTLAPQLAPLEENLLDITLNKQVKGNHSIEVTALDLKALPAAKAAAGIDLLTAEIGKSSCAVASRRVAPPTDNPPTNNPPANNPQVPTSVPSGLAGSASDRTDDGSLNGLLATGALGGLLALSTLAGVGTYRRRLTR